jgi:hypothetical protein
MQNLLKQFKGGGGGGGRRKKSVIGLNPEESRETSSTAEFEQNNTDTEKHNTHTRTASACMATTKETRRRRG